MADVALVALTAGLVAVTAMSITAWADDSGRPPEVGGCAFGVALLSAAVGAWACLVVAVIAVVDWVAWW